MEIMSNEYCTLCGDRLSLEDWQISMKLNTLLVCHPCHIATGIGSGAQA